MKKPNIMRIEQDTHFPQKEWMTVEEIEDNFIDKEIIIMEKYDGKATFDNEMSIFLEDLKHRGKNHIIEYHTERWMLLSAYSEQHDSFIPMVDEYKQFFLTGAYQTWIETRYRNIKTPSVLFRGTVKYTEDFLNLVRIMAGQKSDIENNRERNTEGVVIFSVETKAWGKWHNEWFSYELSKVEN